MLILLALAILKDAIVLEIKFNFGMTRDWFKLTIVNIKETYIITCFGIVTDYVVERTNL